MGVTLTKTFTRGGYGDQSGQILQGLERDKPNIQLKLCPDYKMHWNAEEAEIEGMANQRLSQFEPHLMEKRQSLTQLMILGCA